MELSPLDKLAASPCLTPSAPTHSGYFLDPCAVPQGWRSHLMLMKLPEDMCTCSARISSSFIPATKLKGLQERGRQREEGDSQRL